MRGGTQKHIINGNTLWGDLQALFLAKSCAVSFIQIQPPFINNNYYYLIIIRVLIYVNRKYTKIQGVLQISAENRELFFANGYAMLICRRKE